MLDLDERVTEGLRELARRAPLTADVWSATETHVARRRRTRRVLAGAATTVVLLAGAVGAVGLTRDDGSKARVASTGPAVGEFTIEAAPTGGLTFAPAALRLHTGLYDLTFKDGADAQHALRFDDATTRFQGLEVNASGAAETSRIFFGKAGDYTFYCAVPGHRAAGMQGVVHVTGPDITYAQAVGAETKP